MDSKTVAASSLATTVFKNQLKRFLLACAAAANHRSNAEAENGHRSRLRNGRSGNPVGCVAGKRDVCTLAEAKTVFGDIPCAVGRELTKVHEEFIRGTISEVTAVLAAKKELLGEATVVLSPRTKTEERISDHD